MINVKGFKFSGISCGLKKSKKKDLGLIISSNECISHAVFTKNKVMAAPLIVSKEIINKNKLRAIIVNSGNANACTGDEGIRNVKSVINKAAKVSGLPKNNFFISSTGIIGEQLDVKKINTKLSKLFKDAKPNKSVDFAEAIRTTDKYIKIESTKIKIGNKTGTLLGIAKGAGMIHPNMATMLCYLITDIKINKSTFKKFINYATKNSFNSISVDGDTSTNDTVLGMSNGLAGNEEINLKSKSAKKIYGEIEKIFYNLAKKIVADGEGSTKICKIIVKGAKTEKDSKKIANRISTSLLFKTALFGSDPNWGRIIAAVGSSGVNYIDQRKIDIYINKKNIVKNGLGKKISSFFNRTMRNKEIEIIVDLKIGKASSFVLTNDLGHEYVDINSLYRT